MESNNTRSKRRRLISVSSSVSPLRPDLPATFESLSDDPLTTVLEFVGKKSYRSFGGLNKHCKEVYLNTQGMTKETFLYGYAPLSVIQNRYDDTSVEARGALSKGVVFYNRKDVLDWALQERNINLLKEICFVAVQEERLDLLNKVWNNLEYEGDFREIIFEGMDEYAADCGKLNVLKWYDTKGFNIYKNWYAHAAAEKGHIHILKWLQEEKGLELDGDLYDCAFDGGDNLHVVKWLREQEVPFHERSRWGDCTFARAARKRNLEILQWLHDEGCPWPNNTLLRVHERYLKPEVIEWCRLNGYGDRIVFRIRLI